MACRTIISGSGVTAIACGPRGRDTWCMSCGAASSHLCDYPIRPRAGDRKEPTCDRKICERCLTVQPDGKEFCPPHQRLTDKMSQETKP